MHVHLPAYVSDEGLPAWAGAAAMSLIGAGNVLGTLLSGHLAAKVRAPRPRACGDLPQPLGALRRDRAAARLDRVATALRARARRAHDRDLAADGRDRRRPLRPEYGSTAHVRAFAGHQTGAFAGAWLGGRVYDRFGSYDPMWLVCVALGVLAAADHWTISGVPAHAHAGDMETRAACATMATKPEPPSPEAFELVEPRAHGGASGVGQL